MTQNIREDFWKRVIFINPQNIKEEEIGVVSDDNIKWLINTTLKEIEEDLEELQKMVDEHPMRNELGEKVEIFDNGYSTALARVKQLIHQKLI